MKPLAPQVDFVSCRVPSLGRLGLRVTVPAVWEGGSGTLIETTIERPRHGSYSFSCPTHMFTLAQPVLMSAEELLWKSKAPTGNAELPPGIDNTIV